MSEIDETSSDSYDSLCDSHNDSCQEADYSDFIDLHETSSSTASDRDRALSSRPSSSSIKRKFFNSSSSPQKRKFTASEAPRNIEEIPSTSKSSDNSVRKFVKMDVENIDSTRADCSKRSIDIEVPEPDTADEQVERADEECENRADLSTVSCSDHNSNSEVQDLEEPSEDAVKDDKRSCCTSQASADEACLSSSDSSISSQSSESDIFAAEDLNHHELSDEDDNNNNHSSNDNMYTADSDDESESNSDDEGDDSLERIPQVLKKTLPKQNCNLTREISNRQFQDNFKRKRKIKFENKVYGCSNMVQRLELFKKLEKHNGCVNSIFFNETGEILVSGSDDRHVCLWDWARNKALLYFDTGHLSNIFQAKFLPCTNDTHLVTCGADSQIRMCLLDQCGLKSTSLILKHAKTVHKIALQRQIPNTFLSAGEDGVVYSIDVRESNHFPHKLLKVVHSRSKSNVPVFLYSIDCNPLKNHEFIVCGNDKDIRLYDQRKISPDYSEPVKTFCPTSLNSDEDPFHRMAPSKKYMKSVTSVVFNHNGTEILASYNDNDIYLFDTCMSGEVHHYDGHRNFASIKGVNFYGPRSEYVVSGSDCGHVYLWDKNSEAIVQWMKGDEHIVNCLEPHPLFPVLATSGIDSDVKVWLPTGRGRLNVKESNDFQKVAKKNFFYKFPNASGYSRRWAVLRSSFFADDIAFFQPMEIAENILRYQVTVDMALENEMYNRVWSSSEDQSDSSLE